jgi:hypothetical protein
MLGTVYGAHQREGKRPLKVPPLARHFAVRWIVTHGQLHGLANEGPSGRSGVATELFRNARSLDDLLGRGINQLLDAGCDEISFVALAFKETERVFDGIVGP